MFHTCTLVYHNLWLPLFGCCGFVFIFDLTGAKISYYNAGYKFEGKSISQKGASHCLKLLGFFEISI